MVELDFFQIVLPYSFRLIGPQTKQGYIHPWSVKIGLNTAIENGTLLLFEPCQYMQID